MRPALLVFLAACVAVPAARGLLYPTAPRGNVVDVYHGVEVADPYRWLEDGDAPETRRFVDEQNRLSRAWLDAVPERRAIRARLEQVWDHERYGVPVRRGGRWFFTRNDGLQAQSILMVGAHAEDPGRALLDPNALSRDGTVALGNWTPSDDGRLVAYALSEAGSDWTTLRVREVASGRDLDDRLERVKFSGLSWAQDGSGFYYSAYPLEVADGSGELRDHALYFHRVGSAQADDELVCSQPEQPKRSFSGSVSRDGELLVIRVGQGTERRNGVWIRDLTRPDAPITRLLDAFDAQYDVIGKQGRELYVRTDLDAPLGRVIAVDLDRSGPERWRTVVPESVHRLESALLAGGSIVGSYLEHACSRLRVFGLGGELHGSLDLTGLVSVSGLRGEPGDPVVHFARSGFAEPGSVWSASLDSLQLAPWRVPRVPFDATVFVTEQVFVDSRDGTRLPVFLARRRDLSQGTPVRTLLYGYGGFDSAMRPAFSPANLVWMERGGLYAVACLRGGGEYGRSWHESGTKERKQNVFDDFIAVAEWLIENGHAVPDTLAIRGRSNGGLLVGACLLQRPELFGAALPAVGVLDMLRYHRFTIGWAWASDYGSADDPGAFEYLRAYSPLHNVRAGVEYPATLITTAERDDRVVPLHSYKFAAELQRAQAGSAPILLSVETRAGHGSGKPTAMQIDEAADEWAFLEATLRRRGSSPASR